MQTFELSVGAADDASLHRPTFARMQPSKRLPQRLMQIPKCFDPERYANSMAARCFKQYHPQVVAGDDLGSGETDGCQIIARLFREAANVGGFEVLGVRHDQRLRFWMD